MKMIDCIWEGGKFKGTSVRGFYNELEADKVARADELRLALSRGAKEVEFSIDYSAKGMYSSLWSWSIEGEEDVVKQGLPKVCVHEWTNQSFMHISMGCKHCGAAAPSWIKEKG